LIVAVSPKEQGGFKSKSLEKKEGDRGVALLSPSFNDFLCFNT
jgi:hypothetical protein